MADLPLVGEEFAGYRLLSVLGQGSMGIVFRAVSPRLGTVIALKVLDPSLNSDFVFRTRFLEESRIAASVNHPNVIPILDTGSRGGLLYIAMRCVTGTDLRQILSERGRLPPDRTVFLLSQAANALDAAHRRGLVHRDVKPGNLLVERASDGAGPDHLYLADFGITKQMAGRASLASSGTFPGTIDYAAPEQVRGISVLGLADQYSLGCVFYECLTGRVPFGEDPGPGGTPGRPTLGRAGLPPAADEFFARVLAKNPGDRYGTCSEFIAAAREALVPAGEPPATRDPFPGVLPAYEGAAAYVSWPGGAAYGTGGAYDGEAPAASWPGTVPAPPLVPPAPAAASAGSGGSREPGPEPAWRPSRRASALALVLSAGAVALTMLGFTTASRQAISPPAAASQRLAAGKPPAPGTGSYVPSLAVPAPAGEIQVGRNPSYVQVAPNGEFAYIADPGAGRITVLSTATDLVAGTVQVPQGPPQFVSFSPDSRTAYVSVYNTQGTVHLVVFVDTATGKVTGTVPVNNFTPGVSATSPDGRDLYVPNHNMAMSGTDENVVDVIDLADRRLAGTIAVPANPHWLAFGGNGLLYTSDHMSGEVTVISARTNKIVREIAVGETPHSEAMSPDGSRLAVTSYSGNEVFLVNTATEEEYATIRVGRMPLDVTYSPNGAYIFTANNEDDTVTAINAADNRVIATIQTGKAPTSISVLPSGRQAYVTDAGDGSIEILNIAQAGGTAASAAPSTPAPSTPAASSGMPGM